MEGRTIEKGPERLPTRDEVLEVIGKLAENAQVVRELSDERGLYLLEAEVAGEKPGEIIEYGYLRKGQSPGHPNAAETAIHLTYYQDGMPTGGYRVAYLDNGVWRKGVPYGSPVDGDL